LEIMVRRSRLQRQQVSGKDFLRWIHSKPVYDRWFTSQKGFTLGPTAEWQNRPLWQNDPIMLPFRSLAAIGRVAGYTGPPNRAAAEVVTKYIITDMYAKGYRACRPRMPSSGPMESWRRPIPDGPHRVARRLSRRSFGVTEFMIAALPSF
jgi:hypothetical protein